MLEAFVNRKGTILSPNSKIGIANRGEPALRFVRAVHEYNERMRASLKTVAFYLDIERDAPFVQEADIVVPFSEFEGVEGNHGTCYLDRDLLLTVLTQSGCDAVWVGWGFLSEDAPFVGMIEEAGLVFIGPNSETMALLGDKIKAKALAEENNVPVVPWSKKPIADLRDAEKVAEEIGYPCIIKAAHAGGGRGIRFVRTPQELSAQYKSAKEETIRITGGEVLFIERLVETGRHLEVQVLADRYGKVSTFGVRDCSVQRRNQKIIEETPPPHMSSDEIKSIEAAAARLVTAARYESAGTVEFLYDVTREEFYFMEVNTRLQVEHPITEELYGIDLVEGQIRVAFGERLDAAELFARGTVIEARLNAEDPDREFSPSPGRVTQFQAPAGPGVRVDSGINQSSTIPQEFDSMVAKIIARGADRNDAISRLRRALSEMKIRIEGGTTNRAFLLQLLNSERIREGGVHTRFVEEFLESRSEVITRTQWDKALLAGAVEKYIALNEEEQINFKQQLASNGQPRDISSSEGRRINLNAGGNLYQFLVKAVGDNSFHIDCEDGSVTLQYLKRDHEGILLYNGERYRIQMVERGDTLQCEVDGIPYMLEVESSGYVRAPSPSMVLSIGVKPGGLVNAGDVLATLEAMKMEMIVSAPETGTVQEVLVKPGEQIAAGQAIIKIEAQKRDEREQAATVPRQKITFRTTSENETEQWKLMEREYRAVFLGYDHFSDATKLLQRMESFASDKPDFQQKLFNVLFAGVKMYPRIEKLFSTMPIEAEGFARPASSRELLSHYFRRDVDREKGLPETFIEELHQALKFYPESSEDRPDAERTALFRMYKSHVELEEKQDLLQHTLFAIEQFAVPEQHHEELSNALDQIALLTQVQAPSLADASYHARYILVDKAVLHSLRAEKRAKIERLLELILKHQENISRKNRHLRNIIDSGHHVLPDLVFHSAVKNEPLRKLAWDVLAHRFVRDRTFVRGEYREIGTIPYYIVESRDEERSYQTILIMCHNERIAAVAEKLQTVRDAFVNGGREQSGPVGEAATPEVILLLQVDTYDAERHAVTDVFEGLSFRCRWLSVGVFSSVGTVEFRLFTPNENEGLQEEKAFYKMNPVQQRELRVSRLKNFHLKQLFSTDSVFLLQMTAKENPRDERLLALVDVPTARIEMDIDRRIRRMVALENVFMEAVYAMRAEQARRKRRLHWNRIVVHIRAVLYTNLKQIREYAYIIAGRMEDLGLEKLTVYSRRAVNGDDKTEEIQLDFENTSGTSFTLHSRTPTQEPLQTMDDYVGKVVRARQRGTIYPYELIKMLTRPGYQVTEAFPRGEFEEYDITKDEKTGNYIPVGVKGRTYGENKGNIVFGIVTNFLPTHSKGVKRILVLSDSTKDMGSLAEDECRRINAAIDLAEEQDIPVEWLPISAGARIDMESGTENLDWTARTLRRIIDFTQKGGEINVIVTGINVGAQSYWNAEATMLMHTRGLLIMTEDASMLLTGKKALDFSGGVSAEDNIGIGGLKRIMGPNGQAQIGARNLYEAYTVLFHHYSITYKEPGKLFPAQIKTEDSPERDISTTQYKDSLGQGFSFIGDIFSKKLNPERKKPFDMRQIMASVIDVDTNFLERWAEMQDGETGIVWEARMGGYAVGLIGIESRSLSRIGEIPHDGPESWSGGTLYPVSSKKVARGINSFSARLPLVLLANLSGFDGSPESLRKSQLEFGAEIGRAVVNFKGPIVFVVTARYHGGAYVVFSKTLNPNLHAVALEGAYASVIGGAPAAAVVFPRVVRKETYSDPRIVEAQQKLKEGAQISQKEYDELFYQILTEKQAAIAQRFDSVHSVERAKQVGSIDEIISVAKLRPYLITMIERGMASLQR